MTAVARHDARTLFERAWTHAVGEGWIDAERREALLAEGVRGMRRIAALLGTEHLRDDLERAMRAMLGLVNLHLHKVSGGDVGLAARSIAENGLLFHTKGASQAIKRVLALQQGEDPDELEPATLRRFDAEVVAHWAQLPYAEWSAIERAAAERRRRFGAARALRAVLGNTGPDLDPESAEPYVMTALLILAYAPERVWVKDLRGLELVLERARRFPERFAELPGGVPEAYRPIVDTIWREGAPALMEIVRDADVPIHQLVSGNLDGPGGRLTGRLVFPDAALDEVDAFEAEATSHWLAVTGGRSDDETMLTVMLAGALGESPSLPLSVPVAERLLRRAAEGLPEEGTVRAWLDANAPHAFHDDLVDLWNGFVDDFELQVSDDTPPSSLRRFAREWLRVEAPVAAKVPAAKAPDAEATRAKTPATRPPVARARAAKPPATKGPATKASAAKAPAAKAPAAKAPAAKAPAAKAPATKAPATKAPAAKAPAAKPPAAKASTARTSAGKAPATKAAAAKAPAAKSPDTKTSATKTPAKKTSAKKP